jgi:transporter family protein
MPFYFFAWIAAFSYGLVAIIVKLTSKYSVKNPWLFNFLFQLFVLLIICPIALANGATFAKHWDSLIIASVFFALFGIFYYLAMSKIDVSVFSPLFNFRAIISVLLASLFLEESLKPTQIPLIVFIFISGLFVSIDEHFSLKSFFKPGIFFALASVFSLALNNLFIKKAIMENSYWQLTLWQYLIAQTILLLTIPKFYKDIKKIKLKQIGSILILALVFVVGELAGNKAYADNVGISSIIISLPVSMLLAFAFSIFCPQAS